MTLQCLPGLWDLLGPVSTEQFFAEHWQKFPLYRPAPATGIYNALFRVEQIDELLQAAAGNASEFDYYAAGTSIPQASYAAEGNYVQLNRLLGLYAKGGTIHVSNVQKYSRSLGNFCQRMQVELLVDCEADFWLTRKNEFKPYLHFDRYDIFVLQIQGRKRWRLFNPLAIPDNRIGAALEWGEVGDPVIDVIVEPGDLVYIPPHTPHVVTTVDSHSVHIGIGLHPLTWRQVLDVALEECRNRPNALSETVPLDFVRTLKDFPRSAIEAVKARACEALDAASAKAISERIFDSMVLDVKHADDGHVFRQIIDSAPVTEETRLMVRDATPGRAFIGSDGRATLTYGGGGNISAPASYLPAFEFLISARAPFTAQDIDTSLDSAARVSLLQRAVDAGLCRRAE